MLSDPFLYSFDNKRYHTLNYHFRTMYGRKLYKAVIDCGFTCPNIDGRCGVGGCIFCDGGSGYFADGTASVTEQLDAEYRRISEKNGTVDMIAYFQANTNTYAPTERLRELYYQALDHPRTVGLSVGTRADCLQDDVLDLLSEINGQTLLTVELGLQTIHDRTLRFINRGYGHDRFMEGYNRLKERGIRVCLHIINSLPGETADMMIETARQVGIMKPEGVKLQMLHVIKGTRLAGMYDTGGIELLSREEYTDVIVKQLELLPPETVIERITGDGDKRKLIAPLWSTDKIGVLGGIDKRLAELNTWQSRLYNSQTQRS